METGGSGGSNSGGVGVSETWLVSENFESGKIDLAKWTAPYMTDGAILAVQSNASLSVRHPPILSGRH